MAATSYQETPVRGRTIRLTKLDNCGNPVSGSGASLVTNGFVSLKQTKNVDTGTEIKVRNANDTISTYQKGVVTVLNFDLELQWSVPDLGGILLATSDVPVLDASGLIAGWLEEGLTQLAQYFALEMWSGVANQQCVGTAQEYGYWLFPFCENGYVDYDDASSKEFLPTLKANTRQGTNWQKGPYDVISSAAAPTITPAWLPTALPSNVQRVHFITTVAPPVAPAFAGPQTLTPVSS